MQRKKLERRVCTLKHGPLALDAWLVPKISKRHFFQDIQNYFNEVADIVLEPHQKIFFENISTNMGAREVWSFGTLGGATDPLIE